MVDFWLVWCYNTCIETKKIGRKMSRPQKPKERKERRDNLFSPDLPFGHKVEKDRTKVLDRKRKHKKVGDDE